MTIVSSYEVDNSAALAKRFVSLTRSYFENPKAATESAARVPLENVFRMLQMFRYDSFEDESRRGILAIEGLDVASQDITNSSWHTTIAAALAQALTTAFGSAPKEQAISTLEESLRRLALGKDVPADAAKQAQGFFRAFEALV